jgi:hypothetical protein
MGVHWDRMMLHGDNWWAYGKEWLIGRNNNSLEKSDTWKKW